MEDTKGTYETLKRTKISEMSVLVFQIIKKYDIEFYKLIEASKMSYIIPIMTMYFESDWYTDVAIDIVEENKELIDGVIGYAHIDRKLRAAFIDALISLLFFRLEMNEKSELKIASSKSYYYRFYKASLPHISKAIRDNKSEIMEMRKEMADFAKDLTVVSMLDIFEKYDKLIYDDICSKNAGSVVHYIISKAEQNSSIGNIVDDIIRNCDFSSANKLDNDDNIALKIIQSIGSESLSRKYGAIVIYSNLVGQDSVDSVIKDIESFAATLKILITAVVIRYLEHFSTSEITDKYYSALVSIIYNYIESKNN